MPRSKLAALNIDTSAIVRELTIDAPPVLAAEPARSHLSVIIVQFRSQSAANLLRENREFTPDDPAAAAWPQKQIEETVQPTEAQRGALDNLGTAAAKAADLLKDSCPTQALATPTGRLAAVKARLGAMLEAVKIERPALENFYGSLSDEQKARFNAIGRQRQPDHQG